MSLIWVSSGVMFFAPFRPRKKVIIWFTQRKKSLAEAAHAFAVPIPDLETRDRKIIIDCVWYKFLCWKSHCHWGGVSLWKYYVLVTMHCTIFGIVGDWGAAGLISPAPSSTDSSSNDVFGDAVKSLSSSSGGRFPFIITLPTGSNGEGSKPELSGM